MGFNALRIAECSRHCTSLNNSVAQPTLTTIILPAMLLIHLSYRLSTFDQDDFNICQQKGDYMKENIPLDVVGDDALVRNYWLFPALVVCSLFNKSLRDKMNECYHSEINTIK